MTRTGRPPKHGGEAYHHLVSFRVSARMLEGLRRVSKQHRLPVSEWLREVVARALRVGP